VGARLNLSDVRVGALGAIIVALGAVLCGARPCAAAETAPATAPAMIFKACDGYGAPSASADGITKLKGAWGILPDLPANEVRENDALTMGDTGLRACSAALADPRVTPAIWMRKVSLLRARALHRLAMKDVSGALADLDLAEAAASDAAEPYYRRSLGLGVKFVRAYALHLKGDQVGAETLAMSAWRERPYNRQTTISALIAIGPGADPAKIDDLNRGLARVYPPATNQAFAQMFDAARFADAVALYRQLTPLRKAVGAERLDRTGKFQEPESNRVDAELFWAFRGGQVAYALAALGRGEEARAALAQARARLAAAVQPPPPPPAKADGSPGAPSKELALILADNAQIAKAAGAALDQWAVLATQRALIAEGKIKDVADTLATHPLPKSAYALELVDALIAKVPAREKTFAASLSVIRGQLAPLRVPPADPGASSLFAALPDAEAPVKVNGSKKFSTQDFVWSPEAAGAGDAMTAPATRIVARAPEASRSSIEEMALLHAADMARAAGRKAFIVLYSRDILQIINTTMYGQVIRSDTNGYDGWLDFAPVDPGAPPPVFKDALWRSLDADAVHDSLAPLYADRAKPKAP
jgi:hypothetical protein